MNVNLLWKRSKYNLTPARNQQPAKQTRSGRCQLGSQLCTALHWHDKRDMFYQVHPHKELKIGFLYMWVQESKMPTTMLSTIVPNEGSPIESTPKYNVHPKGKVCMHKKNNKNKSVLKQGTAPSKKAQDSLRESKVHLSLSVVHKSDILWTWAFILQTERIFQNVVMGSNVLKYIYTQLDILEKDVFLFLSWLLLFPQNEEQVLHPLTLKECRRWSQTFSCQKAKMSREILNGWPVTKSVALADVL